MDKGESSRVPRPCIFPLSRTIPFRVFLAAAIKLDPRANRDIRVDRSFSDSEGEAEDSVSSLDSLNSQYQHPAQLGPELCRRPGRLRQPVGEQHARRRKSPCRYRPNVSRGRYSSGCFPYAVGREGISNGPVNGRFDGALRLLSTRR